MPALSWVLFIFGALRGGGLISVWGLHFFNYRGHGSWSCRGVFIFVSYRGVCLVSGGGFFCELYLQTGMSHFYSRLVDSLSKGVNRN